MLKRIIVCLMSAVILLTVTACRSSKDVYSVNSDYKILSTVESDIPKSTESKEPVLQSSSSPTLTKPENASSANSSSKNSIASKTNSENQSSSHTTSKQSSKTQSTTAHTHNYTEATCTQAAKCTVCGHIKTKALGHHYTNGTCIWCFKTEEGFVKYYPNKLPEFTLTELNEIFSKEYVKPKNVIFMIGDGMGQNDITIAEKFGKSLKDYGFAFNNIPHNGFAITDSLDGTTDSAASATALATSTKTKNGYVGVDKDGNSLTNITEIARQYGKKVGVVTNDPMTGATPAAFLAHKLSRADEDGIITSALTFMPEVYVGARPESLKNAKEYLLDKYLVTKELNTINQILNTDNEFKKPYVGFLYGGYENLHNYVSIALTRLKNDNGFFLMIENTAADKAGHSNDMQGKIDAVKIFDDAVITVIDFMKDNPDTLLIITSDHETGGVKLPIDGEKPTDALFTTTGHTSTNVKVFCLGYGSEYFNGKTVDNTDIAKFAIKAVKGEW